MLHFVFWINRTSKVGIYVNEKLTFLKRAPFPTYSRQ